MDESVPSPDPESGLRRIRTARLYLETPLTIFPSHDAHVVHAPQIWVVVWRLSGRGYSPHASSDVTSNGRVSPGEVLQLELEQINPEI